MRRMRALDFFCGTGGFSRGAHAAGFDVVTAFDVDHILTHSFQRNFPDTKLVLGDISKLSREDVLAHSPGPIDLIFGGPPCQGFSSIGRRNKDDPRRTLLQCFFQLVADIAPSAFVMENVLGLGFSDAAPELELAVARLPKSYKIIGPQVLDAADFGAATKRRRLFLIGYHPDRCAPIEWNNIFKTNVAPATVADALSGLDQIKPTKKDDEFDNWQMDAKADLSKYVLGLASDDRTFTGNMRTVHTAKVIERFGQVKQGGTDKVGRHPRLDWQGLCPTLRAGTGSDMGSYQSVRPIHPSEDRVITVREAARLQGFPDSHLFHPTIWHSYRMIGNSVSPIVAEAVLSIIYSKLVSKQAHKQAA
jgi:DNA (cytosine-5)-methyltransferase 1